VKKAAGVGFCKYQHALQNPHECTVYHETLETPYHPERQFFMLFSLSLRQNMQDHGQDHDCDIKYYTFRYFLCLECPTILKNLCIVLDSNLQTYWTKATALYLLAIVSLVYFATTVLWYSFTSVTGDSFMPAFCSSMTASWQLHASFLEALCHFLWQIDNLMTALTSISCQFTSATRFMTASREPRGRFATASSENQNSFSWASWQLHDS
jgi:hypothetical protein